MPTEMLCRRLNTTTMCWEAKGMTSIPDEIMQELARPSATVADLFYVIGVRNKIEAAIAEGSK